MVKKKKSTDDEPKLFDYLNSINTNKKDLAVDGALPNYSKFMINRGLSFFPDTVYFANALNQYSGIPDHTHYKFLLNVVRPRKRFGGKWGSNRVDQDIEILKKHYNYSHRKAVWALKELTESDMQDIRDLYSEGKV